MIPGFIYQLNIVLLEIWVPFCRELDKDTNIFKEKYKFRDT